MVRKGLIVRALHPVVVVIFLVVLLAGREHVHKLVLQVREVLESLLPATLPPRLKRRHGRRVLPPRHIYSSKSKGK
jgi:hypothetical protein